MKHIKKINEAISGTISTTQLYVVKTYTQTDLSTVYSSKRTAQKEKDRLDKEAYDGYKKNFDEFTTSKPIRSKNNLNSDTFEDFLDRNAPKYKIMTLYDAIEEIQDYVRENEDYLNNPTY